MTQLEKLSAVLADGRWHSTEELVYEVGHRFSATMPLEVKEHGDKWQGVVQMAGDSSIGCLR